jgi:hypothetical protein
MIAENRAPPADRFGPAFLNPFRPEGYRGSRFGAVSKSFGDSIRGAAETDFASAGLGATGVMAAARLWPQRATTRRKAWISIGLLK